MYAWHRDLADAHDSRASASHTSLCLGLMTRWGVLSTGAIANDFTLALAKTPGATRHAVASRSQASADAFAAKHGFAKAYASYEALVADKDVEVVYVATPHSFHCDNVMLCLQAGKHVVCEKPMSVNATQAAKCIELARSKKLFLMEGMWTRFFPTTRAVRKLVQDGAIGKVVSITASLGFKSEPDFNERLFKPELAGGALFDVGIYPALWISAFLGAPTKVTAHATMTESGVDAMTFATFQYPDGVMAQMQCGFRGSLANEVVVVGETGQIRVPRPVQAPESYTILTRQGTEPDPMLIRGKSETVLQPLDPPLIGIAPGYNYVGSQGFTFEVAAVQEAIAQGLTEHPEMPLDETLAMAKVFDDIRAQIGLRYPWDDADSSAAGGAKKQRNA